MSRRIAPAYFACLLPFVLLATLNSAGYRYGASDQAFYVPAILLKLHPGWFPRDAPLIASQARFTLVDDSAAALARTFDASLPWLCFALYLATLALLLFAAFRIGARLYRRTWTSVALAAALTLRHAVARTGANTLEGYFHPRVLAFALGLTAVGMFLDRRDRTWPVLLAGAAVVHPTTAVWFGVWLMVATWIARPEARRAVASIAAAAALVATWAVTAGPLAGHLGRMDAAWLQVIASKDYLFPLTWPAGAWVTNLITIPIIVIVWRVRAAHGLAAPREAAVAIGALALAVLFACWLPFDAADVALAVQLQTSRVFWMLDVFATISLVWALGEGMAARPRRAVALAILLAVGSLARGAYALEVQFRERALFAVHLPVTDWTRAMTWARRTDPSSGWLADPMHAVEYGSSVRVAGERDVFLERVKDSAVAMYDRRIAMRVADRERALAAHPWNTAEGARFLSRRYDLDYLVAPGPIDLPVVFRAGSLTIYRLR